MARKFSPALRLADDDLPAGEPGQIEGVQRLAALHQHVVGDVDDVVDRADADRGQPLDQPRRAGPDLDAAHRRGPCSAGIGRDSRSRTFASSAIDGRCAPAARRRESSAGGRTARPTSRAMPMWPRQSGRLLVTSRLIARSSPTACVSSWLSPAIISRSAKSAGVMSSVTYCFNQSQETIMDASDGFEGFVSWVAGCARGELPEDGSRQRRWIKSVADQLMD